MQALYRVNRYPADVRERVAELPPLAVDIANRWMLGWPARVEALISAGEFIIALTHQERAERAAYLSSGNAHLARHEIADLYGLSPAPPKCSTDLE